MSRRLPGFSTDFHGTLRDCLSKAARREHAEVAGDGTKNWLFHTIWVDFEYVKACS